MALTKVSGGILDPGIDVAGIVTATGFDGPFTGGSSKNIIAGIITATELDLNGNVDISGNLVVQGDTTTLNTTLRNVELLRVSAASTLPAGIITQTGTGDILNLFDGTTEVVTVLDGGNVGIGSSAPERKLDVAGIVKIYGDSKGHGIRIDADSTGGTHETLLGTPSGDLRLQAGNGSYFATRGNILIENTSKNIIINAGNDGKVGIGTDNPSASLDVNGDTNLDDVSIAGVTTVATFLQVLGAGGTSDKGFEVRSNSTQDTDTNQAIRVRNNSNTDTFKVSYKGKVTATELDISGNIDVDGQTNLDDVSIVGVVTVTGDITSEDDIIASDELRNNVPGDFWAADNTFINFNGVGNITHMGGYETNITSNGYRDGNGQWVGSNTNSEDGAAQIALKPQGSIVFRTDASKSDGTAHNPTPRLTIDDEGVRPQAGVLNLKNSGSTGNVTINVLGVSGDSRIDLENTGDGNYSGIDFVRERSTGTGVVGGSIFMKSDTSTNDAYLYLQAQSASAQSPVTTALTDNNGVRLILKGGDGIFSVETGSSESFKITSNGNVDIAGEVSTAQDYPNFRPTLDFNFAAEKKLDPRITYSRTGSASFVNEFGNIVLVGGNVPRFDYGYEYVNANSSKFSKGESKGLLIEEERTNLVGYSIYNGDKSGTAQTSSGNIGNWSLTLGHATFTGGIDAPDGSNDAVRFTALNTGFALFRIAIPAFTANGSDSYTLSFYARDISGTGNITCDLQDNQPSLGSWNQNMITNEWVRIVVTNVPPSGTKNFIDIMSNSNNNRVFDIWGVQLEKGLFATSFIPTRNGLTVTRGADFVKVEGEEFAEFYNNATEHTTVMVGKRLGDTVTDGRLYSISDGTSSQVAPDWDFNDDTKLRVSSNVGGSSQMVQELNPFNERNDEFKIAAGMAVNNQIGVVNGTAIASADTNCLMPTGVDRLFFGLRGNGGNQGSLTIKRFMFYPKRLPDSQLVTLTS